MSRLLLELFDFFSYLLNADPPPDPKKAALQRAKELYAKTLRRFRY